MTYEPKHQPSYTQQPPQGPVTYDQPARYNPSANVPPTPHAKLQGVWLYLAILATVYVVASLVLGVVSYTVMQSNARRRSSSYRPTRTTTSAISRHTRAARLAQAATPTAAARCPSRAVCKSRAS